MFLFPNTLVLIKGGGDLGTGVAWRLHRAGFPTVITEVAQPLAVRRTVAFASAVYEGEIAVEGVTAWKAEDADEARELIADGIIPVLVDPECRAREQLHPAVLVDAVMAKRNTGTQISDAPFVIALGPGFTPKVDCQCVVETQRGHNLGRVLWDSPAEPNTSIPGEVGGKSAERVLRAKSDGRIVGVKRIGEIVRAGEIVARVEGHPLSDEGRMRDAGIVAQVDRPSANPVGFASPVNGSSIVAPFDGILRGLVHDGVFVSAGTKIGDVDPRARREHCFTISDKALAVSGGALEAILAWMVMSGRG